jgi:hypothetical protein
MMNELWSAVFFFHGQRYPSLYPMKALSSALLQIGRALGVDYPVASRHPIHGAGFYNQICAERVAMPNGTFKQVRDS